ncbi:DUF115 domain-containing protein [Pseudoalteromonas lipolytica]|uniref:DUF115 domain-containing protein n=1 Tax=Pseudoalteromonas lipolytica TaxID=570156 RepID=A0AAD0WBW8_9GAMM|nr:MULTISPECIES: 6-hydroxymethylpterin diphosphokinase MptE-like protein [Pseudoalteromonas]AXV64630.1 DUF115 domain-containing protein [Pseudoalteromonas donghaensis]QPL43726.1 motility associated factor glycosyltransferase family protein [Pseudoalteromonas sp. A41-2]
MKSTLGLDKELDHLADKLTEVRAHEEREQKFASEANERFVLNLEVFRKYYPDIFNVVSSYKPREDFCLHVTKSGHGNFKPKDSEVVLYSDNPKAQAKEQVDKYTSQANFGRADYFSTQKWDTSPDDDRLHMKYMSKLSGILSERKKERSHKLAFSLPTHYPTALIFGIGLGYHIPELMKKHSFDYVFICEPDFELFFASLFCIDWQKVIHDLDNAGSSLFLSIGVDYESFFEEVYRISLEVGSTAVVNSFCFQHYPSKEINELIKSFFKNYYQLHQGFGFYNDGITGLAHSIYNVENGIEFYFKNEKENQFLDDVPVFVVGNGPSLDQSIDLIRENQDKAIIFAAGTALQSLLKVGITPDFHVIVERPKSQYDVLVDILPREEYKKLNLLSVDVIYPELPKLYKWAGLGLKGPEASTAFLTLHSFLKYRQPITELPASGPFVSNTAFSFATMLGFKNIYLIGVDNGYSLSGQTHSKLSIYSDTGLKSKYSAPAGADIDFEANLNYAVKATPLMAMSKNSLERLARQLPKSVAVYNVGEGARISGTQPLSEDDVILSKVIDDKDMIIEKIKSANFQKVSFDDFEGKLNFDEFESLCDHLIELASSHYSSREEASNLVNRQQRVIYAYKHSAHPHIFNLLKGTMLYFFCPLLTTLYYFEDEKISKDYFSRINKLWIAFLIEVKSDFRVNWKTKCKTVHEAHK